jgi:DNA-binding transcriptional MerR regulator
LTFFGVNDGLFNMSIAQSPLNVEAQLWFGTADELQERLETWVKQLGLGLEIPTVRVIRSWVTKGLFTKKDNRRFRGRQLLESLAILLLQERGWSLKSIAEMLPRFSDAELVANITAGNAAEWVVELEPHSKPSTRSQELAEASVILLAQGMMRLYTRILAGDIVRQDDGLPRELQAAMFKLGRIYIEDGQEDKAACVHEVLHRATEPLSAWGLTPFAAADFKYRDVVLLEPDLRVPTSDSNAIAASAGFGEEEIENRLHSQLREAVDRLGVRQDVAYSLFREFIGRSSLTSEEEIRAWLQQYKLAPLVTTLQEFYDDVPDSWLIEKKANRCKHCGSLLRPHEDTKNFPNGKCMVRQCAQRHAPAIGQRLEAKALKICRPQVLTYWTGPALDELLIFDTAKKLGLEARLYPNSDRCDIAIGEATGIDVKSYSSPVTLALRLNQSISGLVDYKNRVIAISDELFKRRGYLESLKSSLNLTGQVSTLDIMSVSDVINKIYRDVYA